MRVISDQEALSLDTNIAEGDRSYRDRSPRQRKRNVVSEAIERLEVGQILYCEGADWPYLSDPRSLLHQSRRRQRTNKRFAVRRVYNQGIRDFIVVRVDDAT